jgi:hypothetical protein
MVKIIVAEMMSNQIQGNDDNASPSAVENTEQTRRGFLNTFGKLAMVTPVAMTVLMSPSTSAAPKSCRGNGRWKCT